MSNLYIQATLLELQCEVNESSDKEVKKKTAFRNIISQIDKGILLGAPLPSVPNLLTSIATKLNSYCTGKVLYKIIYVNIIINHILIH